MTEEQEKLVRHAANMVIAMFPQYDERKFRAVEVIIGEAVSASVQEIETELLETKIACGNQIADLITENEQLKSAVTK